MIRAIALLLALFATAAPASADFGTLAELLEAMLDAEMKAAEGVSDYAMDITLMGQASTQYFERAALELPGGRSAQTFRLVPFVEVRRRAGQGVSATGMQSHADGLTDASAALDGKLERGMAEAGMPAGLLGTLGSGPGGPDAASRPWLSPDPRTMLGSMAVFMEAGAAAEAEAADALEADARSDAKAMAEFMRRARIVGREKLDARLAYRVEADDLELREPIDDGEMTIRSMTMWIDAERLVSLKMRMNGQMTQGRETRDVFIERLDRDYRTVPESSMFMPYSTVLRMGGVLGPKEQKQLEQAREQLADLDAQMAAMPADQRQMMESRMGPQLEMMRKMVEGGAFEIETTVRAIRINPGVEGAFPGPSLPSGTAALATGAGPGSAPTASAELADQSGPSSASLAPQDEEALRQSREACLQRKVENARAAQKKKKKFGKLLGAVGRMAGRHGGAELAGDIDRVSRDVYDANATAQDLNEAAEALGISRDDVAACQNPS